MKYKPIKDFKNNAGVKKNMIFEWDKEEGCYVTKSLPWFATPLINRTQMNELLKWKLFKKLNN